MQAVRVLSKRQTQLALALLTVLGLAFGLPQPASTPDQSRSLPAISASAIDARLGSNHAGGKSAAIEGWITDRASGVAVSGALVSLSSGVQTTSDARGYFSFDTVQAEQGSQLSGEGVRNARLSVRAVDHAEWTISNVTYYVSDTLRLYPKLEGEGHAAVEVVATKSSYLSATNQLTAGQPEAGHNSAEQLFKAETTGAKSVLGQIAPGAIPASVRVYRTQQSVVEVVPFRDYLKHVLPLEWAPTWGANALKAGAMAAKTYAWYWVNKGGKQTLLAADLKDNDEDQVYDPNVSYASTDAAVDSTFDYVMSLNGSLFQSQYCAGSYMPYPDSDCPWGGPYMTQWGSSYHADHKRSWGWILGFYYPGVVITPDPPGGGYDGTPPPTAPAQPTKVTPLAQPTVVTPLVQSTAVVPVAQPIAVPPQGNTSKPSIPATGQASLQVRVQWLGRKQAPSERWAQPLALRLTVPGKTAVVGTYPGATDKNGVALYQGLPAGQFDVHIKGPHTLQSARAAITLANNAITNVDMKTLVEGDVDGDNCVTVDDFSLVQSLLGASKDTPGFDSMADLNGDGVVSMSDISLLRSGFERCGDISVDKEFTNGAGNSPTTLAGALAPWTNPNTLQHSLTLDIVPSSQNVKVGATLKMDVVAQAGTQPIDGTAFVLKYDAQRFAPVDAAGNSAVGMEPGYTLPGVMGNWIDTKNGAMGFSSGILQGSAKAGRIVVASISFRALGSVGTGPALFYFAPAPSPSMQITNGGDNLLAKANDLTISVVP